LRDGRIGEAAHDQVHFPHAATPRAEQKLTPARLQLVVRRRLAGHGPSGHWANAKNPDVPGEGYIGGRRANVSVGALPISTPARLPPIGARASIADD